uniref:hypothetical protein n=1 Tax=Klebsiella pneumoniae TaxID=573 RepID=UPI001CC1EF19
LKFKRELQKCLAAYHEIHKDLHAKSSQSLITQILKVKSKNIQEFSDNGNLQPILKRSRINRIVSDSDDQ